LDFPADVKTHDLTDEFLFGPALLVCPVTSPMYYEKNSKPVADAKKTREVYLPIGTEWFDLWTEKFFYGGQIISADAPLETMPLFVRAGSILPMTEAMQFVDEKPAAPYEIRIYCGADGSFTLYEDAGNNYDYERGEFAQVLFSWNEAQSELTIGSRQGTFSGLVTRRELRLVFISNRGCETKTVNYTGAELKISV
jgi:alpha-D-xyloside xylohydrolase